VKVKYELNLHKRPSLSLDTVLELFHHISTNSFSNVLINVSHLLCLIFQIGLGASTDNFVPELCKRPYAPLYY